MAIHFIPPPPPHPSQNIHKNKKTKKFPLFLFSNASDTTLFKTIDMTYCD